MESHGLTISLTNMTKKELEIEVKRLTLALEDAEIINTASRDAYATLLDGIKKVLKLKEWPDFHKLYGSGMFASGVIRYLQEQLNSVGGKEI
jgi:hypothetical protein